MRKYLLPEHGNFYKANLHCHCTVSDGKLTPLQVRDLYMRHGYSVVAYTDHNVMVPHHGLRLPDFLPLTGYELDINGPGGKTCHFNFIALSENAVQPVLFRSYVKKESLDAVLAAGIAPDAESYSREYTPENISRIMAAGRERGFFVIYNHPDWSREFPSDYLGYHGMHAMEIVNYSSLVYGFQDVSFRVYDEILHGGERIGCVAADDNHNVYPDESPRSDSCGGWTMIKAPSLEYSSVTSALLAGDYYASTGPEIYELWFEDGRVHVETSDAVFIGAEFCVRKAFSAAAPPGQTVRRADFDVPADGKWFRITVADSSGMCAWTRAYYTDGLPFS